MRWKYRIKQDIGEMDCGGETWTERTRDVYPMMEINTAVLKLRIYYRRENIS